ncbi:winged helix DNA-binding domain-containing protein [Ruminococcaceae bacterium OttesenSCG-928-A16]|nr:winged helix DNA-binding domain-containing protein [Ruminococcaceae bacterium OttesenSCG-928-A16]
MKIEAKQIRNYRLCAHGLDKKRPMGELLEAAGACGLQNSPPGVWEAALFNRLNGCTLTALHHALYSQKTLLQAWSFRGVPVVFPTEQSDIFLTPLVAQQGETPWIYTRGITGALDYLQMSFDDVLERLKKAIVYLDVHTIKSKELLDQTLADIVQKDLPKSKQALWCAPSMYGNPQKQTVGGAAVSFLLRPCSFSSLVVFGQRQGVSPTFTSYKNWVGHLPKTIPGANQKLVRKFLRCYGPTTVDCFASWLGCSPKQARRLWGTVEKELLAVQVEGKTRYLLAAEKERLQLAQSDDERLLLLAPHDPYLDLKDRTIILENAALHKEVWKYVANPGVVLKGGQIIGRWKNKKLKEELDFSIQMWEGALPAEQAQLKQLAEEYAAFRLLRVKNIQIKYA